jgi:hypothetical protein
MREDLTAATNITSLERERLKAAYLECITVCRGSNANRTRLMEVIKGLIDQGVCRKALVVWAVQAGYAKRSASSLLSRVLCSLGLRKRKKGAGRKTAAEALKLAIYARWLHGKDFRRLLQAASRVKEEEISSEKAQSPGRPLSLLMSSISPVSCLLTRDDERMTFVQNHA